MTLDILSEPDIKVTMKINLVKLYNADSQVRTARSPSESNVIIISSVSQEKSSPEVF